uniref:Coronin n=1 Tax=Hirondellea gigas TaxID=1518452 RepID=A0A6A7G2J5_9CRUS
MSIVRESHYRHVYGEEHSTDMSYTSIKALMIGEGNFIKVNPKFFCVAKNGGGGPVFIHSRGQYGRFPLDHPTINVHPSNVLDFDFNPFHDNIIATASDDCTVAVTTFPMEGLTENITKADCYLRGHTKKLTLLQWHPCAEHVLASCSYDRDVKIWDVESQEEAFSVEDNEGNISSLEWSADGTKIMTTARDMKLRVFDPRDPDGAVMTVDTHTNPKTSRGFWVDDKGIVACVGFKKSSQREILFFDQKKMDKPLYKKDLDQANSILNPYYEPANSMLFLAGKGDTGIRYFELTEQQGFCHYLSEFRCGAPQKGVAFMPRRGVDVGKPELLKVYRLTRDAVQPASLVCPRKNAKAVFQEDLYPECPSAEPSMDVDQYFDGEDKSPKMMSLRPKEIEGGGGKRRKRRNKRESSRLLLPILEELRENEDSGVSTDETDAEDSVILKKRIKELETQLKIAEDSMKDSSSELVSTTESRDPNDYDEMAKLIDDLETRLEISEKNGDELLNELVAVKNQMAVSEVMRGDASETSIDMTKIAILQDSATQMKARIKALESALAKDVEVFMAQNDLFLARTEVVKNALAVHGSTLSSADDSASSDDEELNY